ARVDALDDGRLRGRHGRAEEIAGNRDARKAPGRADEWRQQEDAPGQEAGPDQVWQRGSSMEALRPEQRQKQAGAARRGRDRQLERGGAEVAPEYQSDEWGREPGEEGVKKSRRDVDTEGSAGLRAEPRSDHVRPSGLAGTGDRLLGTVPRTIMSHLCVVAAL